MAYNSIGVIITCYNKELYIERALNSILCQDSLPDSLYIVNDCSKDASELIISKNLQRLRDRIKNVEYINLNFNVGAADARNCALKIAQDEYLIFLDADDVYEPNYIRAIRKIVCARSDIGMICSAVIMESNNYVYPSEKVYSTFSSLDGLVFINNPLSSLSIESLFIGGGNVCFRTRDAIGEFFDPAEKNMEEWDFYYRILKNCVNNNSKIIFNREVCYRYNNLDEDSLSRKRISDLKEIKLPKIISELSLDQEKSYRSFLLSIWAYNSICRLANSRLRFAFIKKYFKQLITMQKNRYMFGAILSLLCDDSVFEVFKTQFKKMWYR